MPWPPHRPPAGVQTAGSRRRGWGPASSQAAPASPSPLPSGPRSRWLQQDPGTARPFPDWEVAASGGASTGTSPDGVDRARVDLSRVNGQHLSRGPRAFPAPLGPRKSPQPQWITSTVGHQLTPQGPVPAHRQPLVPGPEIQEPILENFLWILNKIPKPFIKRQTGSIHFLKDDGALYEASAAGTQGEAKTPKERELLSRSSCDIWMPKS